MDHPLVICPRCESKNRLENVLIAQSNQNVIFSCPNCLYQKSNIQTSKG